MRKKALKLSEINRKFPKQTWEFDKDYVIRLIKGRKANKVVPIYHPYGCRDCKDQSTFYRDKKEAQSLTRAFKDWEDYDEALDVELKDINFQLGFEDDYDDDYFDMSFN